jgi:D-arabinose 1-dehydrogenase-like Zn-dependent alcohol dehydrogenase
MRKHGVLVPLEGLALIPDDLSPIEAGPLMCAGITTFNSLRNSGARAGDTVAVLGIGGLGHLGVQFASKMGFRTMTMLRTQASTRSGLALAFGSIATVSRSGEARGGRVAGTTQRRATKPERERRGL